MNDIGCISRIAVFRLRSLFLPLFITMTFIFSGCQKVDTSFNHPGIIMVTRDNKRIVIYDGNNDRILITDRNFKLERIITHGNFYNVWGMCVTAEGEIVVANERTTEVCYSEQERNEKAFVEVMFFDFSGNLKKTFSWFGMKGPVVNPGQVEVLKDGTFMLTDFRKNSVTKFDTSGKPLFSVGEYGDGLGQIYYPLDVRQAPDGNLVLVDGFNHRLQIFEPGGKFLRTISEKGTAEGQLMFPQNICFDKDGNVYVTELSLMRISVFDRDYNFVRTISPQKSGVKEKVIQLFGIAYASDPEELFVADSINSCIYIFDKNGTLLKTVSGFTQ